MTSTDGVNIGDLGMTRSSLPLADQRPKDDCTRIESTIDATGSARITIGKSRQMNSVLRLVYV